MLTWGNYIRTVLNYNNPSRLHANGAWHTTFTSGNLKVCEGEISNRDTIAVSVKVTNVVDRDGEEVVPLYIRDLVGSVTRPVKELKGSQKIGLKAGEMKEVTFRQTYRDLKFYRKDMSLGWGPGKFVVNAGGNSRDARQAEFVLK